MPNLLKSLPREILEKEDTKFIYNVLNPLLFEKVRDVQKDIRKSYTVSELLEKDIKMPGQFDNNFIFPYNLNSREFHAYMDNGQEKTKLERFSKLELVQELDDLKDYMFFYFNTAGYEFIQQIIEKYYGIKNEYEKNKRLYETNYKKYLEAVDIKKKKVFKQTYEHFKALFDKFESLLIEFDLLIKEMSKHNDYSTIQIVNNFASVLGSHLSIKTFDNEIVFESSGLFKYLSEYIDYDSDVSQHVFSGKNIIDTTVFNPNNVFELMAIFSMELSSVKLKYDEYLIKLVDNGYNGYALEKSEHRRLKNSLFGNIKINLDSDNLTYFLNEENNELEIYLYFGRTFRVDESTLKININDRNIPESIISMNGNINYGYTIFNYMDEETKYYKITVHDYLIKDLDGMYLNYDIENIDLEFAAVDSIIQVANTSKEPIIETTSFLDNFVIYKKNESGFFEEMKIPFKIKIDIDEKEERYTRIYEFAGVDNPSHIELIEQEELLISCYSYDYVYEPKIYVDFFKNLNNEINFKYNTIIQYVLIDDVMQQDFEMNYYAEIPIGEFNSNIYKNKLMSNGKVFKKLFDETNQMVLMNPYNETNTEYVSKITYNQYKDRPHTRDILIDEEVKKIPFYENLKYLEKFQYDEYRDTIIFVYLGKQYIIPLHEGLVRDKNIENLHVDKRTSKIYYCDQDMCDEGFVFANEKIYLKNPNTNKYDEIEAATTEDINMSNKEKVIFFDMFEMSHCIIIDGKQYKITNMYVANYDEALTMTDSVLYVESKYGIPRYKTLDNQIIDIDLQTEILDGETPYDGSLIYDRVDNEIIYRHTITDTHTLRLEEIEKTNNKHNLTGMTAFSIFYAGNALPENSNKSFFGRENIFNSMMIPDDVYKIGRNEDYFNDTQHHNLLGEQLDLDIDKASKHNMEHEPYLMFKTSTSSLKGLESYLKSNLKSISQDINVAPVYLVQRNRFISEWARVSSVLPSSDFATEALRELVADLMETKLINGNYDDLIDIFKSNEYEKFSLDTNNIHNILVQYIRRYLEEEFMLEDFNYYLIHNIWMDNNRKKIIDFIKANADESTIKQISTMTFKDNFEKEKLFYTFVTELEKVNKTTIETYRPIETYSDWIDIQENNHVHFEKPFKYEMIDISEFITMPIDWKSPLLLIRPLVDDGVFIKRDYRFMDLSIAANSQITYNDAYNEYVEDIKYKLNKPVNYLDETLRIMQDLALEEGYDYLGINLVIVKWIVERFLPNYILSNTVDNVEELRAVIKTELTSAEHPNMIVSYNRIKESTLLMDLGTNINEIYETVIDSDLVLNSFITLEISDNEELSYLDKVKRPVEHYFDYLFTTKRYDLITKILALFTEDVIASSMLDLSLAINIKNSKGDETYDIYEKMIMELFDEFLPFHSVLDKIIFTIKIMESASGEAISKQADVEVVDNTMIDIFTKFAEKVRIQTLDRAIIAARINVIFPSEGLKLCGGHDEIPYDFDRSVVPGGHDLMEMGHEDYGVDDDWYVINKDNWKKRPESIYTPPEFADLWWECIPENEFEKVVDTYIDDYYHIKQNIFEKDDRIESHFVDYIPTVDITQGISENPEINVIEDYLIAIDTTFNIRFYDMENLPMDEYGLDEYSGPEDQTTLIGMKEAMYQNIVQDFYEKLNVGVLDSVWTDIKVIYDILDIPGHDDFGIDEYYHQRGPDTLGQDMSVMVYDELLHQGFGITAKDMTDVSLVDNNLSKIIATDIEIKANIETADTLHTTIGIWAGREKHSFITENGTFIPGHNEFGYDEFYHDSADLDRIANMVDSTIIDALGVVRVDFGFMRMLPIDPYQDLIDQEFYRANQPGSDVHRARVRDSFVTDIRTFGKDYIGVNTLDFYTIDIVNEDIRRSIYSQIESDDLTGDYFATTFDDSLITRHIHHDFREHIVALDKYANVLDDTTILEIFGVRAANIERDELFELRIGDNVVTDIKVKYPVDRIMTRIDKDYLKAIKIEEENFVDYKYVENDLKVRFGENLKTYYRFNETSSVLLTDANKTIINSFDKENIETTVLEKLHYGYNHTFEVDGMALGTSDSLLEMWSNRIFKDSLIVSAIDGDLATQILSDYEFKEERTTQPHNDYGHMGYTDESIERTVESRLTDSLIGLSEDMFVDKVYTTTYDSMMHDVVDYFGEYINVTISDSLHTYIDIVKKPWIWPEFDEFGHDEQPHMYHGISEEFDVTTQLKDKMKMDANSWLYNAGALVEFSDNIEIGEHHDIGTEKVSVSMVDDLKVVSVGFKDIINISTTDIADITKDINEQPLNIMVQDTVWYGYKLRENSLFIETSDSVDYGYEDMAMRDTVVNTQIRDWLLTNHGFVEAQNISLSDTLSYTGFGSIFKDPEIIDIAIKDTLRIDEFREVHLKDNDLLVSISDKVFIHDNVEMEMGQIKQDKIGVTFKETLSYGPGKWFNEKVRGYIQNRLSIYEETYKGPDIDITLEDSFHEYTEIAPFKDSLGISTYERLKYGLVFKDTLNVNILRDNHLFIEREWIVNRYGVDEVIHDDIGIGMEYPDDVSSDNSFIAQLFDNVKIVADNITFKDTLDIVAIDKIVTGDGVGTGFSIDKNDTGIVISSSDNLMYGVGYYDYIWDAKEWENFGYAVPYEDWTGLIPHDDIPYDELEHGQQGDDLSQITTGVSDNLLYGFDYFFKDSLNVQTQDSGGFSTWGYQSVFKDTVSVWVENRLQTSYADTDDTHVDIQIRKEQMGVSYEFEDTVKTHKYISDRELSTEQIDIHDLETNQLLEQIFKYRIYEEIDVQINSNLLSTALFRFDDELSLVTDYNTKIELYKEQSDGSLAKSMTVIKDKSTSKVSLFFGDFVNASMNDTIQGTYAERPDEYLD